MMDTALAKAEPFSHRDNTWDDYLNRGEVTAQQKMWAERGGIECESDNPRDPPAGPTLEQGDPEGGCDPMGNPGWSRVLAGDVTMERGLFTGARSWQEL